MSTNGYPFMSRAQVLVRIAAEPVFAIECIALIEGAFMASHRSRAAKLIARLAAGAPTPADCAEASELAARYGKTLARVFRERELAVRPELATQAAVFGVVRPETSSETQTRETKAVAGRAAEAAVTGKKRGRPKGSKNKARSEEPKRRKRS